MFLIVCMLLSCHVRVSEWIHTLQLPEFQGTPCQKQARNLIFKWLRLDSNPQLTTKLNHLVSLAKCLSVRSRINVLVSSSPVAATFTMTSDFVSVLSKEFPDIQATLDCGFTLKHVREMIITYRQMHLTDKYSQHSSIIWPVWLNGWVFVYELRGCGFESNCRHLP